ncbi:serine acetyltransferase [Asticcacaulis sp. AND118]|uniref:serine acetyltransferase n=1 Tax=Asticcacaulis sp. AND118 TaxID=2840468 RepID=UPI002714E6C5|nr:serine acetyltransferase [Asticcacaulis sp. AND118]
MTVRAPDDRFAAKVKADLAMWEIAWKKKASPAMLVRLLLFEGGFQLTFLLRLVEAAGRVPVVGALLSLILLYWTNRFFACDFARRLTIGGGLFTPHPTGIVIGADVVIGRNVGIMHQVTIGRGRPGSHTSPRIEDGVYLSPGVKVIGELTVGAGSMVGANAVVNRDIPANSVAVGVPARVIKQNATPDARTLSTADPLPSERV